MKKSTYRGLQPNRLDHEEAALAHGTGVGTQEGAPGQPRPARGRRDAAPPQGRLDRRGRDLVAQLAPLAADALVAPACVLGGQPADQVAHLGEERRPTRPAAPAEGGPLTPDEFPVPAQQRLRADRPQAPPRPRQASAQRGQAETVARPPGGTLDLAPEHADVVPQGQQLDLPRTRIPTPEERKFGEQADERVHDRQEQ